MAPPEIRSYFSVIDLALAPIYLFLILVIANMIRKKNLDSKPYFRFFLPGFVVKLMGCVGLCFVYLYYYGGGDTVNYYYSAEVLSRMLFHEPKVFFDIWLFGNVSKENLSFFTHETGYLKLYTSDKLTFFVARFTTPFVFLSFNSFLVSSLLITCFAYSGIWKMYTVFVREFPDLSKELAIATLFVPSVFFWGSGILKDPITLSATGWVIYAVYELFFVRKSFFINLIYLLTAIWLIFHIKPYIIYVLLPCISIWLLKDSMRKIANPIVKYLSFPFLLAFFTGTAYLLISQIGKDIGKFSIDNIFEQAVAVQMDLKKDYYGGNTFDIGELDASFTGLLSKAPESIVASLFRPFLWEVRNPVMLFSALENSAMLIFTLYLIIKLRGIKILIYANKNPMLMFSLLFALIFSFSVGVSTPNFGSLVRYKIPAIPFYVSSLFILLKMHENHLKKVLPA